MFPWKETSILCLGGAGQVGRELCRRLMELECRAIFLHDLRLEQAEAACRALRSLIPGSPTALIASGGDIFHPKDLGTWRCEEGDSGQWRFSDARLDPICTNDELIHSRPDLLEILYRFNLEPLTPDRVKQSLLWCLASAYRPDVMIDTINTATALGYKNDIIAHSRDMHGVIQDVLGSLSDGKGENASLDFAAYATRLESLEKPKLEKVSRDLLGLLASCFRMNALLNSAAICRYVQCLNAMFDADSAPAEEGGARIPQLKRYVKVHTTGLGGMGFNLRYTHGDCSEEGLSTSLLGKVCVAGSTLQLLLGLAHTPGRDVRAVIPATLIGWEDPGDFVVRGKPPRWSWSEKKWAPAAFGPLPEIDSEEPLPLSGELSLGDAIRNSTERCQRISPALRLPYIKSGENKPYAIEDLTAVTALGQMGCITKEEVARAVLDCVQGDSRYDALTALDASLLLPTQSAAVLRDRTLRRYRPHVFEGENMPRPSVSLGNLGPTTTKQLYEIEILRQGFPTVAEIASATPFELLAVACGFIGSEAGTVLRRQIVSLGIPIVMQRGMDQSEILLGDFLAFPENPADWDVSLDLANPRIRAWIDTGWIDLSLRSVETWWRRFVRVREALERERAVYQDWFSPDDPFSAGQFLGFYHSISGGNRKHYL